MPDAAKHQPLQYHVFPRYPLYYDGTNESLINKRIQSFHDASPLYLKIQAERHLLTGSGYNRCAQRPHRRCNK